MELILITFTLMIKIKLILINKDNKLIFYMVYRDGEGFFTSVINYKNKSQINQIYKIYTKSNLSIKSPDLINWITLKLAGKLI